MYKLTWHIKIGGYRLQTLKSLVINSSVLNLSDTAVIELPCKHMNQWRKVEGEIHAGDDVCIQLGYDNALETEFNGYLKSIKRENNSLVLECIDALYLMDNTLSDMEYKSVGLKLLLQDILAQIDPEMRVDCDYDFTYEKMVVFKSTALDVLKKIHEDTKANIYFEGKTLHVHPVYQQLSGDKACVFDMRKNVQSSNLKWVDKNDKKVQVEVKYINPDGKIDKREYGVNGGQKVTRYVQSSNEGDLKRAAENEYNLWNYSGYEGDFTGWLIPRVQAGGSVRLTDKDRNETGIYYVTGVEIEFGQSGAKRKVSLGRKLS